MAVQHTFLCVVPTRLPLGELVHRQLETWLDACDRVVLSVARAEFGAATSHVLRPRATALSPEVLVAATHAQHKPVYYHGKAYSWDVWNVIRAGLAFVSSNQTLVEDADWLVMAEDDAYVSMPRLRRFTSAYDTRRPYFFGGCLCDRSPGVNIFSRAALHRVLATLGLCEPDHDHHDRWGDPHGASDKSVMACLARSRVNCTSPMDPRGDMMLSVYHRFDARTWRTALANLSDDAYQPYCGRAIESLSQCDGTAHCTSPAAFGFHKVPDASIVGEMHASLLRSAAQAQAQPARASGRPALHQHLDLPSIKKHMS